MIPSSTSLIKGLASADACAEASRCGSPIRHNHLTPGGAKRQCSIRGRAYDVISAQVIDTIVEWIDDNLHQPLRIDDIARHAGYSKWHLQRLFLQYKGEPGALYSRKEAAAGRDLRDTDPAGLRYLPEVWLRFATDLYPRLHPDLQSAAGRLP